MQYDWTGGVTHLVEDGQRDGQRGAGVGRVHDAGDAALRRAAGQQQVHLRQSWRNAGLPGHPAADTWRVASLATAEALQPLGGQSLGRVKPDGNQSWRAAPTCFLE
jgi:hypothetical protein